MHLQKESICDYIDDNVLDIAENLVNIIEEDIMLNWRIVMSCQKGYSEYGYHKESVGKNNIGYFYRIPDREVYIESFTNLKGKKKEEAEKRNEILKKKYTELKYIIDNFVEIIVEEKKIELHIAKAVAWKAITTKLIQYYGEKWQNEYDAHLEIGYDNINEISSDKENEATTEYIRECILCEEIDIDSSKELLMYFLLYKSNQREGCNLLEAFDSFYNLFDEILDDVNSNNIKNKLKTKQKRAITKYSIDDIDLMTGTEFEEFIGLLFKKWDIHRKLQNIQATKELML